MDMLVDIASGVFLAAGSFFILVGSLGMVRMPDVYTRMHAASLVDTLGAGFFIAGLMIQGGMTLISVKLLMMLVFVFFASPTASYALANAAWSQGVKPVTADDETDEKGGESSNP
ncbi:MAG: monovalent cation/H(+) antiporter subunit G [Proteobacteria bacterium]|nr:monovalent cation/H(+) antiporter subunit G [Pseudomonadota bacterium]